MSQRALTIGGGIAAAGVGYYLYQAGGDPKAAEKRAEHDMARLRSGARGSAGDKGEEAKTSGKVLAADAGAKVDQYVTDAKKATSDIDAKLEQYRKDAEKKVDAFSKDAGKELNSAVDKFDKSVTESASKAKSGISSWFGGK